MQTTDHEVIDVLYEQIDGIHIFTATSENGKGLFVGHYDLRVAYDEVAFQLKNLLRVNLGKEGVLVPEVPFEEFATWATQRTDEEAVLESHSRNPVKWMEAA